MARKMYVWSPIVLVDPVKGDGTTITLPVGSEVVKKDVGDDWDNLIAAGSIRPTEYPKNIRSTESPRNAILRENNERMRAVMEPYQADADVEEEEPTTPSS